MYALLAPWGNSLKEALNGVQCETPAGLSIPLLLIHLWYQSSCTHVFTWEGPNTSWSECNLLDLSKTKPTFFNRCSVILVVGSSSSTTWKWLWMWHFHSANPTFRKLTCLVFLLGTHQTASQGPVFTFISKFSIVLKNLQDIWREQICSRKGRRLWKPLAAGDKENKNTDRRVGEGSRNAVRQLEQRMQSLNETWGLGDPNMPQTADMLFSLILPICDSAAAQTSQDCWEGTALFHWRTGNLLLTCCEKKEWSGRVGMFAHPWMEANKLCWDGKRLAGLRAPSPALGLQGQLPEPAWMQHSLRQLSKPLGRHGHNKSLGIKAAAEEVAGEGQWSH